MSPLTILTIADVHGVKPVLAKKLIKKYNPDFLVCTGDLPVSDTMRRLIFEHWRELKKGKTLEDVIGKNKLLDLRKKAVNSTYKILDYLDSLGKKVYLIYGNHDYTDKDVKSLPFKAKGIEQYAKKKRNVQLLVSSRVKMKEYVLIGVSGYRPYSDIAKLKAPEPALLKKFRRLFSKTKSKKKLFMYHDPPYNTRLDKIRNKESPLNGTHIGDPYINIIIRKYKPLLYICGHMHENPGTIKLGRTVCLNTGIIQHNDYFIIHINDRKVSVKRVR